MSAVSSPSIQPTDHVRKCRTRRSFAPEPPRKGWVLQRTRRADGTWLDYWATPSGVPHIEFSEHSYQRRHLPAVTLPLPDAPVRPYHPLPKKLKTHCQRNRKGQQRRDLARLENVLHKLWRIVPELCTGKLQIPHDVLELFLIQQAGARPINRRRLRKALAAHPHIEFNADGMRFKDCDGLVSSAAEQQIFVAHRAAQRRLHASKSRAAARPQAKKTQHSCAAVSSVSACNQDAIKKRKRQSKQPLALGHESVPNSFSERQRQDRGLFSKGTKPSTPQDGLSPLPDTSAKTVKKAVGGVNALGNRGDQKPKTVAEARYQRLSAVSQAEREDAIARVEAAAPKWSVLTTSASANEPKDEVMPWAKFLTASPSPAAVTGLNQDAAAQVASAQPPAPLPAQACQSVPQREAMCAVANTLASVLQTLGSGSASLAASATPATRQTQGDLSEMSSAKLTELDGNTWAQQPALAAKTSLEVTEQAMLDDLHAASKQGSLAIQTPPMLGKPTVSVAPSRKMRPQDWTRLRQANPLLEMLDPRYVADKEYEINQVAAALHALRCMKKVPRNAVRVFVNALKNFKFKWGVRADDLAWQTDLAWLPHTDGLTRVYF